MPATVFKGAISFGLVSVPVRLVAATEQKRVPLHRVHKTDNGRVRNRRVCELDGQELDDEDIARGYLAPDGREAVLTDEDFARLPLPSTHAIELESFVDPGQVDPVQYGRAYLVEPEAKRPAKPYVLLREALAETGAAGIGRVALQSKERLAMLRPEGDVLVLQLLLWPDEVRDRGRLHVPGDQVHGNEVKMATSLIDSMSEPFDADRLPGDRYREALRELVDAKLENAPLPEPEAPEEQEAQVTDLMDALRESLAKTRGGGRKKAAKTGGGRRPQREAPAEKAPAGKRTSAKKTPAKKAPAKKAAEKKTAEKKTAGERRRRAS